MLQWFNASDAIAFGKHMAQETARVDILATIAARPDAPFTHGQASAGATARE